MISDALAYLSWSGLLIAIAALLAFYLMFIFLQARQLKNEKADGCEPMPQTAQPDAATRVDTQNPNEVLVSPDKREVTELHSSKNEILPPHEMPVDARVSHQLETQKQAIAELREEIIKLKTQVHQLQEAQYNALPQVHATQNISPGYGEAMQMAMRGESADNISQVCGISRAEADLVASLARNGGEPRRVL